MPAKNEFKAEIQIIGINPFVDVPEDILNKVFKQAGRSKSPIPIKGTVNGKSYHQTLVRYSGAWRLYINTVMLEHSPKRIGETIVVTVSFDPVERKIEAHPELLKALSENKEAKAVFDGLTPSLRHEIVRYISNLKTQESIGKNVQKAIDFLLGKGRFVGRELKN
ncbi:YdeI/OmpD-associated family protein [Pedobacter frigoris]|uniref:YdeI/OmpD-associated family protein n=1 Tax=Pedobacter frigoris TaxID=2571272 RepID=UPI0029308CB4|nr:YdeI/OmpD-associated family protein [Pedobacter frigoris]